VTANTLATILSAIASILGILFAVLQRPRFKLFIRAVANANALMDKNASLEEKLRQAHTDLVDARNSLTIAQGTATFNITQFDELRGRIAELEEMCTENGVFIRAAITYIDALEATLAEHKIDLPANVKKPAIPRHLREGR
jgi:DNA repair ATPase RecN